MQDDYYSSYNRPVDVFELVKQDIEKRNQIGFEIHGKRLMPGDDSKDWLWEAYEEALDKLIYLRMEIEKRKVQP